MDELSIGIAAPMPRAADVVCATRCRSPASCRDLDVRARATRARRMDECLHIVRELQSGASVTFTGEFFDLDDVVIDPAPAPPIPLIVGGPPPLFVAPRLGDEEAERAGRPDVAWRHGMTVWCGFGSAPADGSAAVAPVMEHMRHARPSNPSPTRRSSV